MPPAPAICLINLSQAAVADSSVSTASASTWRISDRSASTWAARSNSSQLLRWLTTCAARPSGTY